MMIGGGEGRWRWEWEVQMGEEGDIYRQEIFTVSCLHPV